MAYFKSLVFDKSVFVCVLTQDETIIYLFNVYVYGERWIGLNNATYFTLLVVLLALKNTWNSTIKFIQKKHKKRTMPEQIA